MKRLLFIALVLSLIINLAIPAFCDDSTTKLGRGLSNIITFPLEIPEQISRVNNTDGPFAAMTVGVLRGLGSAIERMCIGLGETLTFMSPGANEYKSTLKDPEYFLETSNF